jgi:hypothetical protein
LGSHLTLCPTICRGDQALNELLLIGETGFSR